MTRQKKNRKPGILGVKSQPKDLREQRTGTAKKAQKTKGKPAGNRHNIEAEVPKNAGQTEGHKDPRVGSKRKVDLQMPESKPAETRPIVSKATAKAPAAEPVPVSQSVTIDMAQAEDEFAKLENDPRLQDLLAQLDAGDALSAEDSRWVETQLDRYRQLANELGIDMDELDEDTEDEDELEPWKKFDDPKDWV